MRMWHGGERRCDWGESGGLQLETLEGELPEGARVVRVMPNTPCSIGQAASTFAMGSNTTAQDQEKVELLMSSVGKPPPPPRLRRTHLSYSLTTLSSMPATVLTAVDDTVKPSILLFCTFAMVHGQEL